VDQRRIDLGVYEYIGQRHMLVGSMKGTSSVLPHIGVESSLTEEIGTCPAAYPHSLRPLAEDRLYSIDQCQKGRSLALRVEDVT